MKEKKYYMWDNDEKELICQTDNTIEAFMAALGAMVRHEAVVLPMEWRTNSLGTARGGHDGWDVVKMAAEAYNRIKNLVQAQSNADMGKEYAPIKYEIYEGNDGGVYLYILGEDGKAKALYSGWERAPEPGIMLDVVAALEMGIGPEIIYKVGCDIESEYAHSCLDHELIAYNGWVQRGALMEAAGRRAFGYPEW